MQKNIFFIVTILLTLSTAGCSKATPSMCPLTLGEAFTAPTPYSPSAPGSNLFWYGDEKLWTALPKNGTWTGLPQSSEGYTQKILWWSNSFSVENEPKPKLTVIGDRLDAEAPPLNVSKATNASAEDIGTAMLVGVDFPTYGCWRITGKYKGTSLSFVVQVSP